MNSTNVLELLILYNAILHIRRTHKVGAYTLLKADQEAIDILNDASRRIAFGDKGAA